MSPSSRVPRRRGAALIASVALLAVACGYRLVGSGGPGGVLPAHVKIVVVAPFDNRTQRPEIEQRVTEEISRQLSQRGGYQLATERSEAQALLEGAVTSYRTSPVQFSPQGRATRVEAVVTLRATLRDLTTDSVLWSQDGLVFREQFAVSESPESGEFFDQETVALDEIARGAAGALVTSMLEGF